MNVPQIQVSFQTARPESDDDAGSTRRPTFSALVDVQPTFMPGGELPVPDGDAVVPVINRLLARFAHAFATQDWHPPGHMPPSPARIRAAQPYDTIECRMAGRCFGRTMRCRNSANAALHPALDQRPDRGDHPQGLPIRRSTAIRPSSRTITERRPGWRAGCGSAASGGVFLAGLATDFCVAWSAEDAARLGYEVIDDRGRLPRHRACPAGDGRTTMDDARDRLMAKGVRFVESGEVLR